MCGEREVAFLTAVGSTYVAGVCICIGRTEKTSIELLLSEADDEKQSLGEVVGRIESTYTSEREKVEFPRPSSRRRNGSGNTNKGLHTSPLLHTLVREAAAEDAFGLLCKYTDHNISQSQSSCTVYFYGMCLVYEGCAVSVTQCLSCIATTRVRKAK